MAVFGAALSLFAAGAAEIDLAGTWRLAQADDPSVTCPASVPGGIYAALYDAKLIPDPYFAQNEKLTQWPSRADWLFARSFTLPDGFAAAKSVVLRLEDAWRVRRQLIHALSRRATYDIFLTEGSRHDARRVQECVLCHAPPRDVQIGNLWESEGTHLAKPL